MRRRVFGALGGVAAGAFVLALGGTPAFAGLSFQAVCGLGILAGAIVWWIAAVLPEYATALVMSVLFIVVSGVPTESVFSTFSTSIWWLLVAAFGLGLGMRKSGLLRRVAFGVLKLFPRTFKSQAAGLVCAGTLVGPLIPSLAAKASIIAPLALSVSDSMGYARKSRESSGLFLAMFTGLRNVGPVVISSSIIGYALLGTLPAEVCQQFDMLHWAMGMLPWFVVVTLLNYAGIVVLFGPRRADRCADRCANGVRKGARVGSGDVRGCASAEDGEVGEAGSFASHTPAADSVNSAPSPSSADAELFDLGPMSRDEKRMLAIILCCVALWVLEPVHHVASHVVALSALVAMVACGIVGKEDLRSGVAWDSLVFIGIVLGLANVFAYLGIDVWVVGLCQPLFASLAQNPYAFVAGIGLATLVLRFLIVSETAFINLFMAFMVPLSVSLGINPWVVGVSVYAMVNPWFATYQNSIYLTAYYATEGDMVRHGVSAGYCALYQVICLVGLMVSVPWWQAWGLL